jgi:DNA-binding transcriptional MerR regulator
MGEQQDRLPMDELEEERHSIGEVIALLKTEFPEVTVSKVRFLEGQGLIDPERSPSGYRIFSKEDLSRLQFILREQRDHFLPLKVIKSKLTAWERGEDPPSRPESGPPPEAYFATAGVSLTREELGRAAGLSERQLSALLDQGLFEPMELTDGTEVFVDDDMAIARAAARLLAEGLEARHLRAIRLAADREVELLHQLVSPFLRHRNPDNRRRAAETLANCAQAGSQLQEAMVRSRLRRLLEG